MSPILQGIFSYMICTLYTMHGIFTIMNYFLMSIENVKNMKMTLKLNLYECYALFPAWCPQKITCKISKETQQN